MYAYASYTTWLLQHNRFSTLAAFANAAAGPQAYNGAAATIPQCPPLGPQAFPSSQVPSASHAVPCPRSRTSISQLLVRVEWPRSAVCVGDRASYGRLCASRGRAESAFVDTVARGHVGLRSEGDALRDRVNWTWKGVTG